MLNMYQVNGIHLASFKVPQMPSARFVRAFFCGQWERCWLQNEDNYGYWVAFDSDTPFFRRVDKIEELPSMFDL